MFEVLNHYLPQIDASNVLEKLNLEDGKFFVVSSHREENINSKKISGFNDIFKCNC
jgi:UDP-N-acetylglucosamine 2-epimerase (non-hydrolysing)